MRLDTPTSSPQHMTVNSDSDNDDMNHHDEDDVYHLALDEEADELVEVDEEEFERLAGQMSLSNSDPSLNEVDEEHELLYANTRRISSKVVLFHEESIFSASFNPSGDLVATAAQENIGRVWSFEGGISILFNATGHEESVSEAKFSYDGSYLATADLNGLVKVWKVSTKTLHDEYNMGSEVAWMFWHPASNVLFAGCKSGDSYMWRLPMTQFKILLGRGKLNQCGTLLPDGKRLVVGYTDGSVRLFDLKTAKELLSYQQPDGCRVTDVDAYRDNNVIAAAFNNGSIVLIKASNGSVIGTLQRPEHLVQIARSAHTTPATMSLEEAAALTPDEKVDYNKSTYIECLKFGIGPADGILAEACDDGVHLWDFARQTLRKSVILPGESVSRCVWHKEGVIFVAGLLKNYIYGIDGRSGQVIITMNEHVSQVLDVVLSSDHSHLVSTSDDFSARVFPLTNLTETINQAQNASSLRN